jgi:sulfate-transporting ATPase
VDRFKPEGPPGQEQGPRQGLRGTAGAGQRRVERRGADHHSAGPRLGTRSSNPMENVSKSYGDRLLIDNLNFKLPPGGIVGVIGPNGAGKTTLFRMLTGQESPTPARSRSATRRSTWVMSTSHAMRSIPTRRSGGNLRRARHSRHAGQAADAEPGLCRPSTSAAWTSRRRSAQLSGGERNRVHLAKMLKAAPTCCCSTNRPTTSTSKRCARLKMR